jgi:hypothetical protein
MMTREKRVVKEKGEWDEPCADSHVVTRVLPRATCVALRNAASGGNPEAFSPATGSPFPRMFDSVLDILAFSDTKVGRGGSGRVSWSGASV